MQNGGDWKLRLGLAFLGADDSNDFVVDFDRVLDQLAVVIGEIAGESLSKCFLGRFVNIHI